MISARYSKIKPTLNDKGADAFVSTTNPALDIFTYTSKSFPTNLEKFKELTEKLIEVKNKNSELFLKLIKFHRLIQKGNGIKNIYYLSMCILKKEDPLMYSKILVWSYEYPKDILNLCRFNSSFDIQKDVIPTSSFKYSKYWSSTSKGSKGSKMTVFENKFGRSIIDTRQKNIHAPCEIRIYGDLVIDTFFKLLSGSNDYNPMLLKYMGYETGHWAVETHFIWDYLEHKLGSDDEFTQLVNSTTNLDNELATQLREYLKNNKSNLIWFTNKNRRKLKKIFNSQVNLTDNLYKGIHSDGSAFGSHASHTTEVELIYQVLKKTPTISLKKFTSTVSKYSYSETPLSVRNKLLLDGYNRYTQALVRNETKAKVHGLDISAKCYQFFQSNNTTDIELEAQISQLILQFRNTILSTFNDEFTFEHFAESIVLILDISGSMEGIPIQTGLFYFLMMVKVFGIIELYYFESSAQKITLNQEDINSSVCTLIKKIYKPVSGSTSLSSAFDILESESKSNKIVMVITDGDCDPCGYYPHRTVNPFHEATNPGRYIHLPTNNYIVINVKLEKLNFPYIDIDPKVCYLTGNNPKTINGLIKSMIISTRDKIPITPDLILTHSLDMEELELPEIPNQYSMILSEEEISSLFRVILKNIPSKPDGILPDDNYINDRNSLNSETSDDNLSNLQSNYSSDEDP